MSACSPKAATRGRAARFAAAPIAAPIAAPLAALALLAAGVAGCSGHTPQGQVVAVVNNQEITYQDLNAEARAEGQGAPADPKILLQKVISRVLLAQEAKNQGLDRNPAYPSDLKRLEQTLLADKLVQSTLKPPRQPAEAELQALMDAHPNIFKDHARIQLLETPLPAGIDLKSVQNLESMDALVLRLKELGSPVTPQSKTVDSADLDPGLAQKLASEPQGSLFLLQGQAQGQGMTVAIVVQAQTPEPLPDDAAHALAARLFAQQQTAAQIQAQVQRLKAAANIQYQPKFEPQQTNPGAAANAAAKPAGG
ncbi:MAG: hypothetical protein JO303_01915 [Caulobacteraceae bacterium]|nr:hypothetical protein [Caulobacteraceae bacterium]